MRLVFFILWLFQLIVDGATGDILSVTVDSDGWHVLVEIEGLTTGGTYSTRLGLGADNIPEDGDPDIVLTVTSQGYTGTSLGTRVRTVFATEEQRLPYPNEATNDENANGGDVIVKLVLSEYIFEDDESGAGKSGTDITYDIDAAFYNDGSNNNNAATGTAVNNSTITYANTLIIAKWSWPDRERVTGEFLVNLQAYHHFGQQKRPVATVVFNVSDGTTSIDDIQTVQWIDYPKGKNSFFPEFVGHFDASDFMDDTVLTVNATIYPWIGDAPLASSSGASAPSVNIGPRSLYCDNDDDVGLWAMVDPVNGSDSTGAAVTFANFDVSEAPYQTVDGAAADGATNIWLVEGNYTGQGGTTAGVTNPGYWLTIRGAFGTDPANVVLTTGSTWTSNLGERVKFQDLTITSTTTDAIDEIDEVWFDNVTFNTTNTSLVSNSGSGVAWATNSTVTQFSQGFDGKTGEDMPWMVRDILITGSIGGMKPYLVTGVHKTSIGTSTFIDDDTSAGGPSCEGAIVSFCRLNGFTGASVPVRMREDASTTLGWAFVNNVVERSADPDQSLADIGASAGSVNTPINNVILWNNVFVGGRCQVGYNDTGTESRVRNFWSVKNNYWDRRGLKSDLFGTPNGNRIGNWTLMWMVGCSGNVDAVVSGIGSGDFDPEYEGLHSLGPTDGQSASYPLFVDRQSTDGIDPGNGNGDYYVQASSPLIGLPRDMPVAFDLEQSPRAIGDACGSYTYYPSGTTYYVRKDGNDGNPGTGDDSSNAFLTAQAGVDAAVNPGDTVLIREGYYNEIVVAANNGARRALITVDSTDHKATLRGFRFGSGLNGGVVHNKLTRTRLCGVSDYPEYWAEQDGDDERFGAGAPALVFIPQNAHHSIVDDCIIDSAGSKFTDGIYWFICDHPPFGVKDAAGSYCKVTNNFIHNIWGRTVIEMAGDGNLVQNNRATTLYEADLFKPFGRNHIIADNHFEHNDDLPENTGNHMDCFQVFGTNGHGSTGIIIERNTFKEINGGQISQLTDNYTARMVMGDWIIRNNVFDTISNPSSCSIQGIKWYGNDFIRCNYLFGHALACGQRTSGGGTSKAHGYEVIGNVFYDCGQPYPDTNDGWYGIEPGIGLVNVIADYNYVSKGGNAVDGDSTIPVGDPGDNWSKFDWYEPNGRNGGSAGFVHFGSDDYRLISGSALIGDGVTIPGLTVDFLGDTRPSPPAIGAFEQFSGNVRYVSTSGDNGDDGSSGMPWLTITFSETQLADGDVLLIQPGTYDEEVAISGPGGLNRRERTRIVADGGTVIVTAIRIQEPYVELNGLTFRGMQNVTNQWDSHLRIENSGDYLLVKDCHFGPGVYFIPSTNDVTFDEGTDTVTFPGANLTALGFKAGGEIRFGMSSYTVDEVEIHAYDNGNNEAVAGNGPHILNSVGTTTLTVEATPGLLTENGDPAWAPVYVGPDKHGMPGLGCIKSGGTGADHIRVTGCTFQDLFGHSIINEGDYNEYDRNTITEANSWSAARLKDDHVLFHHNLIYNNPQTVIQFTTQETGDIVHNFGDEYDFIAGHLHTQASEGDSVQIYRNWMQNVEAPIAQIGEQAGDTVFYFWGNVCAGVSIPASNGRDYSHIFNNTFYRCGIKYPFDQAFTGGPTSPDIQLDTVFRRNVFVDCGAKDTPNAVPYSFINQAGSTLFDYNYCTGWSIGGFTVPSNFVSDETHGIEGGDPLFLDPDDPLGPDGLPFTADDGLRSQMYSPLVLGDGNNGAPEEQYDAYWAGAVDPYELTEAICGPTGTEPNGVSAPAAVFRVDAISTGFNWYDPINPFDAAWRALPAYERDGEERPWSTPEAAGSVGVQVTFEGEDSIDGLVSKVYSNAGITNYAWSTSDGGSQSGASSSFVHTFSTGGSHTVTLTITNSDAETDAITKTYRVLTSGGVVTVSGDVNANSVAIP